MQNECMVGDYTFSGHGIHNGICTFCCETADEASEFDFIRAWHSLLGEDVVTEDDIASRIERGHLPNVSSRNGKAAVSTATFLKTLVDGTVVMNNGITIVDVVALPDGDYQTVRRRDETDTLMRTPAART